MKKLTMAALLAGQIAGAAPPALAADFAEARDQRAGAFAGFRLRLPLDGAERRQVRAGLTLAPALHSRTASGRSVMRIGEGLEFGYRANRPLSVSLRPRPQPAPARRRAERRRRWRHTDRGSGRRRPRTRLCGGLLLVRRSNRLRRRRRVQLGPLRRNVTAWLGRVAAAPRYIPMDLVAIAGLGISWRISRSFMPPAGQFAVIAVKSRSTKARNSPGDRILANRRGG